MPEEPTPRRLAPVHRSLRRIEIFLAALLALFLLWSLYVAKTVVLPVVLGFLIALTLTPLVRWLHRKGIPEGVSAVVLIFTIGIVSILGLYALRGPAETLINDAPEIQEEVQRKTWKILRNFERLQEASQEVSQMAAGNGSENEEETVVVSPATGLLQAALGSLVTSGTVLAVALLFAMFLLSMGDSFRSRLVQAFPDFRRKRRAARISRDVERQVSRYLAAITVINAALGLCVGIAMELLGMPYALLWGAAAFLLNYLPYLGAIIGACVAGAVALVTYDSTGAALLVPVVYLGLTSLEGQMITPWMVGRHLQLNAASVFIAVVFWAWLWGAAGAVLAVPLLVMVKVLCDNVPGLTKLGSFLEGRTPRRRRPPAMGDRALRGI